MCWTGRAASVPKSGSRFLAPGDSWRPPPSQPHYRRLWPGSFQSGFLTCMCGRSQHLEPCALGSRPVGARPPWVRGSSWGAAGTRALELDRSRMERRGQVELSAFQKEAGLAHFAWLRLGGAGAFAGEGCPPALGPILTVRARGVLPSLPLSRHLLALASEDVGKCRLLHK